MKYRPDQKELSKPPLYRSYTKQTKAYIGVTTPGPVDPTLKGAN